MSVIEAMKMVGLGGLLLVAGCAVTPRFPALAERYDTVVVGEVVAVRPARPRVLLEDLCSAATSPPAGEVLFPHAEVSLVIRDVDHNESGLALADGDTIMVQCLAGTTSDPFSGRNGDKVRVVCDYYLPGWTLGQTGIFVLGACQGQWALAG